MANLPSGPSASDPGANYRHSTVPRQAHINLQFSEGLVFQAAAQIFAASVAAGKVTPVNESQMMDYSVEAAIKLAQRVDAKVESAEETDRPGNVPL